MDNTETIVHSTSSLLSFIKNQSYSKAILLSDETVYPLFGTVLKQQLDILLPTETIVLPSGEISKTVEMAQHCWEKMVSLKTDRKSVLIALGGGVITDLGGFVAGCYMRGIDVIHVPTTLLGMVDGAIGGKCGVNLKEGKNLIGLFYPPKLILICLEYLNALPKREFCSGLAEVIKYGVIYDEPFFAFLEQSIEALLKRDQLLLKKIIERSIEIKQMIVDSDSQDQHQKRAILNWGHTLGHAIETFTEYKVYTHGEAISIGMHFAALLSYRLGLADLSFVQRQNRLLQRANLPTHLPQQISREKLVQIMASDKKAINGTLSFILAYDFGNLFQYPALNKDVILKILIDISH